MYGGKEMSVSQQISIIIEQMPTTEQLFFLELVKRWSMDKNAIDKQARKELKELFNEAQRQSVHNGTDNISMDEINAIIMECQQEMSAAE
jgi:hypothetical protein